MSVMDMCNHFTTNLLNMEKPTKKLLHTKKVGGNCVVLFSNAQLDISSLQRQSQKVTQEMVEITHHLSLVLNERCFFQTFAWYYKGYASLKQFQSLFVQVGD